MCWIEKISSFQIENVLKKLFNFKYTKKNQYLLQIINFSLQIYKLSIRSIRQRQIRKKIMNYYPFMTAYSVYGEDNYFSNFQLMKKFENISELLSQKNEEIQALKRQNQSLRNTVNELQRKLENEEKKTKVIRKTTKNYYRRNAGQGLGKDSRVYCPYNDCHHHYSSILALNFHIKYKHNGGNKKERQAYAKIIVQAEQKGQQPPKISFNFPPGFLQKYRQSYFKQKKYTDLSKKDTNNTKDRENSNVEAE